MAVTGLMGGTFDPPHYGHVALARAGREHFRLDALEIRVVADPGHRSATAPADARLELTRAAFAALGATVALERHSYTVDSLEAERPEDGVFLIGADELAAFLSWKEPDRVLELTRLGVATRPGYSRKEADAVLARLAQPERVELFALEPLPISSTEIRDLVRRGDSIDELVPPAVAERIAELGLYVAAPTVDIRRTRLH